MYENQEVSGFFSYSVGKLKFLACKALNQKDLQDTKKFFEYRTRAIIGRSRLVAAPLRFQAKIQLSCRFYVMIFSLKK